jgi:hypothetical protein
MLFRKKKGLYMTYGNEKFLKPAINIFKGKYPKVEIEIVDFASVVESSGNLCHSCP